MRAILISDIHLCPTRPNVTRAFNRFISSLPPDVEELYILGDLFEAWLGDDDPSHFASAVKETISQVSQSGISVFFQAGNRDFLLGKRFSKKTGVRLLPEFAVTNIAGRQVLLTHGDLLCTDDHAYQKFRSRIRSTLSLWVIKRLPFSIRARLASKLRNTSKDATMQKAEDIMDVNNDTVLNTLRSFDVTTMIHGHTHRPNVHQLELDGSPAERYTLGDWDTKLWWVDAIADKIELKSHPIEEPVLWMVG